MLDWLPTPRLRPVLTLLGLSGAAGTRGLRRRQRRTQQPVCDASDHGRAGRAAGYRYRLLGCACHAADYLWSRTLLRLQLQCYRLAGSAKCCRRHDRAGAQQGNFGHRRRITVNDSAGQTAQVKVTVTAAPIFNALTFVPSDGDCGTNLCSGQNGVATVVATAPGGAPLVARAIKFDVIFGPIGFTSSNPPRRSSTL